MWYFLIPYILFAFLGLISLIVNVFHIAKFGLQSGKTSALLAGYILAYLFVCAFTAMIILSFEWKDKIQVTDLFRPNFSQANIFDL